MTYTTPEQVRNAAGAAYRTWRSYGWAEGAAEQAAAEFYAYQMAELKKRQGSEIRSVCAWCGAHIGGPVNAPPERTSHGICARCRRTVEAELGMEVVA